MIHSTKMDQYWSFWIQPSDSVTFLMKRGCKGHSGHGGCWGCRGHSGCRGSKFWKITTKDFRVIQVLEFSFNLMFWKDIVLVESWNIILKFSTFSVGGCWGQPMLLVDETQMPTSHKATRQHNSKKCWSFYPSEPFIFTRFTMRHTVLYNNTGAYFFVCLFVKQTNKQINGSVLLRE